MDRYGGAGMSGMAGEVTGNGSGAGGRHARPARSPDDDLWLSCRVYTHARRHPVVIGNIQGLRIPPVTPAQLFIGVGSLALLILTQPLWARLGAVLNSAIMFGVPLGLAFAARALRVEGRAPWRAGLGWLVLMTSPRRGTRLGRIERAERPARSYRPRIWVAELPGHPPEPVVRSPATGWVRGNREGGR